MQSVARCNDLVAKKENIKLKPFTNFGDKIIP